MTQNNLYIPLLVQVLLTFVLLLRMAYLRVSSLLKGQVKMADIALGQRAWAENAIKAQNSFHNQFEMPVLFYVVIVVAGLNNFNSVLFTILSWVFVTARILHAIVHNTTNNVPLRFRFFLMSCVSLFALWVILALQLLRP